MKKIISVFSILVMMFSLSACSEFEPEPEPEPGPATVNVYTASDLDSYIQTAIEESLQLAIDAWGLYWSVEYWVLGIDETAAVELIESFCTIRDDLNQWDYDECIDRETQPGDYSMKYYQQMAADALEEGRPFSTAAWGGNPEWGIHRFTSTHPWGLTGMMGIPGADDVKTVFHEYWHGVQNSFIDRSIIYENREDLMGPVWFVEGSAEYQAAYLAGSLMGSNSFPDVPSEHANWTWEFISFMENKMRYIDDQLASTCEGLEIIDMTEHGSECTYPIGYEMGSWAIAYLIHLMDDPDILLDSFYPQLEALGWENAFEASFGMSVQAFNDQFMEFWQTDNRTDILPNFNN